MGISWKEMSLSYPKVKRTVNRNLLDEIMEEQLTCLVGMDKRYGSCSGPHCPHHIISRGAGGDDSRGNIIRVCLHHHQMIHNGLISKEYLYELIG